MIEFNSHSASSARDDRCRPRDYARLLRERVAVAGQAARSLLVHLFRLRASRAGEQCPDQHDYERSLHPIPLPAPQPDPKVPQQSRSLAQTTDNVVISMTIAAVSKLFALVAQADLLQLGNGT